MSQNRWAIEIGVIKDEGLHQMIEHPLNASVHPDILPPRFVEHAC